MLVSHASVRISDLCSVTVSSNVRWLKTGIGVFFPMEGRRYRIRPEFKQSTKALGELAKPVLYRWILRMKSHHVAVHAKCGS